MKMGNMVLLVVDVQAALIESHPYNEHKVIENIKRLISTARENKTEVVYVRHDGGKEDELEYGTDGWQIYAEVATAYGERIFDKRYNSAFLHTGLKEYLEAGKVDTIVLVGLQTEYCIDATVKAAFEYGYKLIIPEAANTTFDNEYLPGDKLYEFYNHKIWNRRFAAVVPVEEAVKALGGSEAVLF